MPVLVFFHGGRFALGNTNSPFYDGQVLAGEENVVVVTVTYRLNIFGFPGGPETAQNLGLRDQRMAVQWVRDNISNFGGDPSRIVIFGQSSGGVAVDYWAYAYREDPIVSGLISHSGNALSFPLNEPERQVSNWYNVTQVLGCGSDGSTLGCMRTRSWSDILQAASRVPATPGGSPVRSTPAFYPKADGEAVFPDYGERSRTGQFARLVSTPCAQVLEVHSIVDGAVTLMCTSITAIRPREQRERARVLCDTSIRAWHKCDQGPGRRLFADHIHLPKPPPGSESPRSGRARLAIPILWRLGERKAVPYKRSVSWHGVAHGTWKLGSRQRTAEE